MFRTPQHLPTVAFWVVGPGPVTQFGSYFLISSYSQFFIDVIATDARQRKGGKEIEKMKLKAPCPKPLNITSFGPPQVIATSLEQIVLKRFFLVSNCVFKKGFVYHCRVFVI